MKKVAKKRSVAVVVLLVSLLATGCSILLVGVVAVAGIGAYKYVKGESIRQYSVSYESGWKACERTLKDLEMPFYTDTKGPLKGTLKATNSAGKTVIVTVRSLPKNVTRISIRIGTFGDRLASERMHEIIAGKLGLKR